MSLKMSLIVQGTYIKDIFNDINTQISFEATALEQLCLKCRLTLHQFNLNLVCQELPKIIFICHQQYFLFGPP